MNQTFESFYENFDVNKTFWADDSPHQAFATQLESLIPVVGPSAHPEINAYLCISKMYHRFYNDGDGWDSFWKEFGSMFAKEYNVNTGRIQGVFWHLDVPGLRKKAKTIKHTYSDDFDTAYAIKLEWVLSRALIKAVQQLTSDGLIATSGVFTTSPKTV
jgi:hypothetical protein